MSKILTATKVLIIEDEAMLRTAYETVLKANDFEVMTAVNGKDGLNKLKNFEPQIILLDLLMPQMDGKSFLRKVDITRTYPKTKIIVYSNLFDSDTTEEVLQLGAIRTILKSSMTPNELVEVLRELAAKA